jgi:uncharacterized membrane protein
MTEEEKKKLAEYRESQKATLRNEQLVMEITQKHRVVCLLDTVSVSYTIDLQELLDSNIVALSSKDIYINDLYSKNDNFYIKLVIAARRIYTLVLNTNLETINQIKDKHKSHLEIGAVFVFSANRIIKDESSPISYIIHGELIDFKELE